MLASISKTTFRSFSDSRPSKSSSNRELTKERKLSSGKFVLSMSMAMAGTFFQMA